MDPIQLFQLQQMMQQRQMQPFGTQPMGQPSGQLPSFSQPQQAPQQLPPLGQPQDPNAQQQQHHSNPFGGFAPMFGLAGMLGGSGALPYMLGGVGGGLLFSHLFGKR